MVSLAVLACFAAANVAAAAEPATAPPVLSPFGPGYDPTRPPPVAPAPTGAGFVAANVVGSGLAEVQELPGTPFFGVVLDVRVEAGSTTRMIDASVVAQTENGNSSPLIAGCVPLMENPLAMSYREGVKTGHWHIHVDRRTWFCGGRTARLAIRVGTGGFAITAGAEPLDVPLVLLFAHEAETSRRIVLPGLTVELPLPGKDDDRKP